MLHELSWYLVNLLAALVRAFVIWGSPLVADNDAATAIRMVPVIFLAFAAIRQVQRWRLVRASGLILMDLYFLFNRLTVFAVKPMTLAELLGNLGMLVVAFALLMPGRPDRPPALIRRLGAWRQRRSERVRN
ncbi:hypothetical protein [Deinococcus sp. UYEF24]